MTPQKYKFVSNWGKAMKGVMRFHPPNQHKKKKVEYKLLLSYLVDDIFNIYNILQGHLTVCFKY